MFVRSYVPSLPALSRATAQRHIFGMAVVLLLLATALPAASASPEEARIAATRAELEAVRAELETARDAADGDLIALEEADRQLRAAFDAVEAAAQAVNRQSDAVADAEQRLGVAQADLAAQRELMAQRISRLYRQARPDPLIQVLDASSVTQAVQQSAYMSAIGRQDRAAVENLGNAEMRVAAEERALEAETVSLSRVLEEQQAVLAQVEEMRQDRALVAAASEDLVAQLQARETHLEEESAELAALAAQREAQERAAREAAEAAASAPQGPTGGGSGGSASGGGSGEAAQPVAQPVSAPPPPSGGGFSWPTSGSVTSGFGPRWGRQHEGIDIANGTGTPVAAARGGTVIHAGTYGGYGNLVLISHSGGFVTAYAHLSEIAVSQGQSVSTGTYLGGMGCTGSCTGTHLHFEIRANGQPVDPMAYL
jgi:septal ring factor EnvC (AmiA/AmiB activator)